MTSKPRRSYGTGTLEVRSDSAGRETYYGRFYAHGRQARVKLGPKRNANTRDGLTRTAAERLLQKLIDEHRQLVPAADRVNLQQAGDRYLTHLEQVMHRKPSTIQDYRIILDRHLAPFFTGRTLERIDAQLVSDFLIAQQRRGLTPKTVGNQLTFLHGIFRHAIKRGWTHANPVAAIDRPRPDGADPDIRFLTQEEVEAVLRHVTNPEFGTVDLPLILVAVTAGLRQGELVALRWRDVDWTAGVIRVRRNYTRGAWGTPKSRRSSRAVPMLTRTATALEHLSQQSGFTADDDLVFAHPILGSVLDASALRKRFKTYIARAGVRDVRFHDLRHTFGTQAASAGIPLRTLQEWMGHRDYKTTLIYADYQPHTHEHALLEQAFSNEASTRSSPTHARPSIEP